MTTMEYADFLFNSLQDARAEIKRSHDEIERLTGEVGQLRLNNQALERHLREAEYKLNGEDDMYLKGLVRSLTQRGFTVPQIATKLRIDISAVEDVLKP